MNSKDYLNKKNKYISVRRKIQNTFTYFDSCISSIKVASLHLENLIINDKMIDDGKLNEDLNKLTKAKEDLQMLVKECNKKIDEYDKLYKKAIAAEMASVEENNNDDI